MEEKESIKVSLSTVICIVVITLLIAALVGMWYYYNSGINENNKNAENDNISEMEKTENKTIDKIYEDKEMVYSSYSKFSSEYSYTLPYINIKSTDVANINKKIEDLYKPSIEEEISNEAQGLSVVMSNIKYNSFLNDNVLSLVIITSLPNDCTEYKVYNIDIYTGKQISNTELLNMKNITEKAFLNKLETLYKEKFISLYGTEDSYINNLRIAPAGWTEEQLKEKSNEYKEQLNRTIAHSNYSIETPMFLGEDGKLNVVATIYSLAGAKSYDYIIDTGI